MELATEAIKECTKEVDGKKVPSWDIEEVNEIVIAQVVQCIKLPIARQHFCSNAISKYFSSRYYFS